MSAADSPAETADESGSIGKTLQLGALFGLWYLFNIYNKQVLKVFRFLINIMEVQFRIGSVVVLLMWATGLHKRPSISGSQVLFLLANYASKACCDIASGDGAHAGELVHEHELGQGGRILHSHDKDAVVLSALVLGETPSPLIVASLVPIVGGVALASLTEASFNWAVFLSAMASNLTLQSRNVLSKKLMVKKEGSLDNNNLFSIITIMSFFLLAPATLLLEGVKFTPAYLTSAGLDVKVVMLRALLAGLCFHSYQQVSYMILQRVAPVTHSVGNCVKRVIVIVTSVLFFRTTVTTVNALGTGVALAGVFAYSQVKRIKPKKSE